MKIFKIDAKYNKKIFVPYIAIEKNYEFATCSWRDDIYVVTNDGKISKMLSHKEVNILSQDALKIIYETFPKMTPYIYLQKWYERYNGNLHTLDFQYIELDEPDNTISIPATTD